MLYIFHVNSGRMLRFDMNLALTSVQKLKETIERLHGLPAANQVLLVSGGELLLSGSLVCSYSAGTDTNPIYMFTTIETKPLPQPWPSIEPDDLKDRIEHCLSLPATYSTVVARAQLAQQIYDLAREEESICEKLVHEQHLQQQGWATVVANMEDLTDEFRQRFDNFCKCFDEHLSRRDEYLQFLAQFNEDLEKLAKIPILPGLMQHAEQEFHGFDEFFENDEVFNSKEQQQSQGSNKSRERSQSREKSLPKDPKSNESSHISSAEHKSRCLTLLQWISAKENHKPLRLMAEECARGLDLFDNEKVKCVKDRVMVVIRHSEQEDIKEIKGIDDRLSGLERLMQELRKQVQDQKELAAAFQQNQNRASNLGDPSILPDLCNSHKNHLLVMLQNQKKLRDIRRRISKAKDELATNLNKRLKIVVHIENSMSELDNSLLFYHRCLRRVQRHLSIIEQIHQAPSIYVTAVTEVVRRRIFSSAFLLWSSDLACDLLTIYNDEMMRRQEFSVMFDGHFLNTLFPGMDDTPPAFANEAPSVFDSSLPSLTKNDIDVLSSYLPDLTSKIQLPDLGAVIDFFTIRSGSKSQEKSSLSDGKLQIAAAAAAGQMLLHRPIDVHAHLKDGFESETDTEEFEKVGQSPNERRNLSSATNTVATSTSAFEKPEMANMSTSTEIVRTQNTETLTEIALPQICPPKKPPRLSKLPSSKCNENMLPSIPEIHTSHQKSTESTIVRDSSFSSSSDDPSLSSPHSNHNIIKDDVYVGHQESETHELQLNPTITEEHNVFENDKHQQSSPLSPYPMHNVLIDNEFVNSDFYIDESLPSSINDDYINDSNDGDNSQPSKNDMFLSTKADNDRSDVDGGTIDNDVQNKSTFGSRESLETVITLLQENLGSTRLEVESLKSLMNRMSQISRDSLALLKNELDSIRTESETRKEELKSEVNKLSQAWDNVREESESRNREAIQRLTVDHELEINDMRKSLHSKDFEIEVLKQDKNSLETSHAETVESLNKELSKLKEEIDRLNKINESLDCQIKNVTHEHRTEIESLRCRFKLMESTKKSPSDTSLEKIEKPEMIDLAAHESVLNQIRRELKTEREIAIKNAIDAERLRWESLSSTIPILTQSELKKIIDEKDKQLDLYKEQWDITSKDNFRLQSKIQALTTDEGSEHLWFKEKLDSLNHEKIRLLEELNMEKSRRLEMEASVISMRSSISTREIGTCPDSNITKPSVTIDSCTEGDIVFIIWNNKHGQYIIVQNSSTLYFLHSDSHSVMNLKTPPNGDSALSEPVFCVGRVVYKEYCHARRDENRYRVSKGTKFYRVKVQPVLRSPDSSRAHRRDRTEANAKTTTSSISVSSQSIPVSRSTSTQHLIDSFAQTEKIGIQSTGRDMVDSGVAETVRSDYKERTISVTEEDEPLSISHERCRYISVSEEEEKALIEAESNQDCATPSLQLPTECSSEKDQEDSDEYRSLEAKDDLEFPTCVT